MRTNFDFTPLRRSSIGFDQLFDLLQSGTPPLAPDGYPPFDLEHDGGDGHRITLAVAGFGQDEIEIVTEQNLLTVAGRKREDKGGDYVHRGIATRPFERRFVLGDYVRVRGAELRDGLLTISLVREIPEEMKPRRIAIGTPSAQVSDDGADRLAGNENQPERNAA